MQKIVLKSKKDDTPLEKVIEEYLRKEVAKIGGKAYKFKSEQNNSVHDRMCVLPEGVVYFVEVKRPGKAPTKLQTKTIKEFRDKGHYSTWVSTKVEVNWLVQRMKVTINYAQRTREEVLCLRKGES